MVVRRGSRAASRSAAGSLEASDSCSHTKASEKLLELVRTGSADELLLFSHARSEGEAARWADAARGLPVHRVAEFLPTEDVAARLAAEADVLVFWYDEIDSPTTSGAVRIGLASGVPVLTSPTSWFADLREVTYQPHDLLEGVRRVLEDTALRERLVSAAREHCHEHSWPRVAERHVALWRSLERG
jgi:glycosyltransferase involved in cell wall biosynthesis